MATKCREMAQTSFVVLTNSTWNIHLIGIGILYTIDVIYGPWCVTNFYFWPLNQRRRAGKQQIKWYQYNIQFQSGQLVHFFFSRKRSGIFFDDAWRNTWVVQKWLSTSTKYNYLTVIILEIYTLNILIVYRSCFWAIFSH